MRPEFLERANRIAADNISSQQQILKDTLDMLSAFSVDEASLASFVRDLKSLSTAISNAQSQMSAVSNVCRFVISASDRMNHEEICAYLKSLRNKIETAPYQAAKHSSGLVANGRNYATISQSEFVLTTFEQAADEDKHVTVFVMESRPLFEGRQTARALMKMGHRAVLVSDASIGIFIKEIDSAFVGADSILSDGTLINKIGSYPLAACCAASRKNFYTVTSILKYDSENTPENFINKEESANEIYANPEFEVRNFYYDKVDPRLITAIITEIGTVSPLSGFDNLDPMMMELYG